MTLPSTPSLALRRASRRTPRSSRSRTSASTVRALSGRVSGLSVSHSKSALLYEWAGRLTATIAVFGPGSGPQRRLRHPRPGHDGCDTAEPGGMRCAVLQEPENMRSVPLVCRVQNDVWELHHGWRAVLLRDRPFRVT
jgi:hypothetical protein